MTEGWHKLTYRAPSDQRTMHPMTAHIEAELAVRNLRFPTGPEVPRYWHGDRRAVTLFFDNLSLFFPAGEAFFVAAVKRYKKRVKDPRLAADVAAFCAQEGIHRREHVRYNEMQEGHGAPAAELEAGVERLLDHVTATAPPRWQLAATCALEHFTATLAHIILSDPRHMEGAHPVMASLWRWHAAEENEHKAVAFDLYRAVGGHYAERVWLMILATAIFWSKVAQHQVRMMDAAGILYDAREWRDLLRFLFVEPGALRPMARLYLDYFRPSFHPWDLDNRDVLEAWKREAVA
jgi:predicted metal-dependent hydrolase